MGKVYHEWVLALVALAAVAGGCGHPTSGSPATTRTVHFVSADGVELTASLYAAAGERPPGLVLVPMLGADRGVWEAFAARAQRAGYTCLAVDLRGHGDSTRQRDGRLDYRKFSDEDWRAATQDIDAAKGALMDAGADPENWALVGASIGANLCLHCALAHEDVPAVVLISPGLEYHGVTTENEIAELGKRPVLLMTSQGDAYSASSCATLKKAASGLCELREYKGSAHGTDIFADSTAAMEQILVWLRPILGPANESCLPGARDAAILCRNAE
ncbi:MAG TPA: alpha/beta fold hydrolase [Candidatus Hydrogenedentes bacterium]|nr:alpha/beta fold hydrolase [Candidatus Hydrogenedentota bacterium]HPG66143.1 alpha/beta fold hydrolase [Candidatus Hydrogenedentota bacterium]